MNDSNGGVALGGQFLLGHLVSLVGPALLNGIGDLVADGLGLDYVVTAVDLGEVLSFWGSSLGALCILLALFLTGRQLSAGQRTRLPVVYFFSVPRTAPDRCAAFSCERPLTVVSRGPEAPPRALVPIFVTVSQSDMVDSLENAVRIVDTEVELLWAVLGRDDRVRLENEII